MPDLQVFNSRLELGNDRVVAARALKQIIAKAATSVHSPSLAGFTLLELPLCNFFSFFKKTINLIKKYELIPSPPAFFWCCNVC